MAFVHTAGSNHEAIRSLSPECLRAWLDCAESPGTAWYMLKEAGIEIAYYQRPANAPASLVSETGFIAGGTAAESPHREWYPILFAFQDKWIDRIREHLMAIMVRNHPGSIPAGFIHFESHVIEPEAADATI